MNILQSFLAIALELTVLFVAVSFLVSLIQGLLPYDKLHAMLAGRNAAFGAFAALLLAFATPFCSCSTIPLVVNLLQKKIRFGVVMVFLFASPILDPTIITLMAATLGAKTAIAYTAITSVFSLAIGFVLERLGFESAVKQVVMTGYAERREPFSVKKALGETLALMKTVYPYLLVGAAIGSVVHGLVPSEWIAAYLGGTSWWVVPVAAIVGIPLYVRLSTMIPLSQILIAKGMAIAPVMALMISSAGASLPEVALLHSIFRKRLVYAFVFSVFCMATLSGWLFYLL